MLDVQILKLLGSVEGYARYAELVQPSTMDGEMIIQDMGEYISQTKAFDWKSFGAWFFNVKHPTLKSERRELLRDVIISLMNAPEHDDAQQQVLLQAMNERHYANEMRRLCEQILDGSGDKGIEDMAELLKRANDDSTLLADIDEHIVSADLEDIVESMATSHGLSWRLPELNRSVGVIRKGDMVLFSARPETGKTTMLASETSWFAEQCKDHPDYKDRPIVWLNNEEEGKKVKLRIMQAALGCTTKRIMNDPKGAKRAYEQVVGHADRIIVYDNKRMHYKEIEKFLAKHNPCVVVYDQLRKVSGFNREGSEVQRLQQLYGKHARAMAAEFGPVLTVHQARGDAEGVDYLQANQLEGSQTEVQGELDVQIMLGKRADSVYDNVRYINIVKNKLLGSDGTEERLRHGKFEVYIKPEIARFESPLGGK